MANETTLNANVRGKVGTVAARALRREGKVPVVIYGRGLDPRHLWVAHKEFQDELDRGNRVFSLSVDGELFMTLVKEIQMDTFQESIIHADFLHIEADTEVALNVALVTKGTPKGEMDGGRLHQPVRELAVLAKPNAIPENIVVDVSDMVIGDALTTGDLALPPGVTLDGDPTLTICTVQPPAGGSEEEEEEEAMEADSKEPELIGRQKKEEEEESK